MSNVQAALVLIILIALVLASCLDGFLYWFEYRS